MMNRVLVLSLLLTSLLTFSALAAAQSPCESSSYAFVVYSDDYMTGEWSGFDLQILQKMFSLDPNVRMIISAGDETPIQDARTAINSILASHLNCGEPEFPFFSAMGNHNLDGDDTSINWFTTTYGSNWAAAPETSRLALQLPGISNFSRGPLQVLTPLGTRNIPNASVYSFDFKNAHFVVLNNFELGANRADVDYGVWDYNGASISDPSNSQLDWLQDDLARTTQPLKFVISHVGLVAPWYDLNGSMTPGCEAWSEHQAWEQSDPNSPFHTKELAAVLAKFTGVTIFRGHDHCPSRDLVNGSDLKLFERSYWDAYRDPNRPLGDPSLWEGLMAPGTIWQIDDGSAYNDTGFFVLTRVSPYTVTFETYRWDQSQGPLVLWDKFSIPVPDAAPDVEPPRVPTNIVGTALSPFQISLSWQASTDNVGTIGYNIFRNGQQIGTSTPTTYIDSGLTPGTTYSYTISAFDKAGNVSSLSAEVLASTAAPDNTPPTVSILSPLMGATVTGTININATATDDVKLAGVQFMLDGSPLGIEDTVAPFTLSWNTRNVANGMHTLIAVARDAGENRTTSEPVAVKTNNDFTAPLISSIAFALSTNSAVITWITDEPSNTQVQYGTTSAYGSQTALVSTLVTSHSATITGLRVGTLYHFRVRSADSYGNVALSADRTLIIPDVQPPTSPAPLQVQPGVSKVGLTWKASTDNVGVAGYRVFRNSVLIVTRPASARTYSDTGLTPRTLYSYAVEAFDAAGNTSPRATNSATTLADTTLPTVSLTAPASGAVVSSVVTVSANASDNVRVAGVQFRIDSVNVQSEDTTAPYSISWDTHTLTNGTHSITAVARDTSGNVRISSARSVTVRN